MMISSLTSADSQVFHLADFVMYTQKFPCLIGKKVIGRGCYSYVFEGETPGTVLKLTCDPVYAEFVRMKSGAPGVAKVVEDFGSIESNELGRVSLFALERLSHLQKWHHDSMILERDALLSTVSFKIAMSEIDTGMMPCQVAHAMALEEVRDSRMFSDTVGSALMAISDYMKTTEQDVLLDLGNPDNYMTDGRSLVITDPLMLVH